MNIIDDLKWRGILNSVTNQEKLNSAIDNKMCAYIGFDPSASSLHLGNYVMLLMIRRLNNAGIKTYAVVGGATGMIGDPSGKSHERNLLDFETVYNNKLSIINQLKKYATHDILDNYDNFKNMNYLTFLREIGKVVNINYLLEKEIIKSRLETSGMSYTEFSYNLIQSYDFYIFYKKYNIAIQVGGSDQWGNITAGIEMIRKLIGEDNLSCGFTLNLLTNNEGKKFGKSEKGAIYLDEKLTSPYLMYQFLINQPDSEIIKLLKFLTLLSKEQIEQIESLHNLNPKDHIAQKELTKWVITDIHGKATYERLLEISTRLFKGDIKLLSTSELKMALADVPSNYLEDDYINIVDYLVISNISSSKREARELITNNSIMINGEKITDLNFTINKSIAFDNEFIITRKGKKNYFISYWK